MKPFVLVRLASSGQNPRSAITEFESKNIFMTPDRFCRSEFQIYGSNLGGFFFFSKRILPPFLNVFLAQAAQSYFYLKAVNLVLLRRESRACVRKPAACLAAQQPLRASLVLGHLGKASLNYVPKEAVGF